MIMPRASGQLLMPVNPLFVWTSLIVAFVLNIVPLGRVPAMPDFLALVLVFWNVHQSRRVGVGVAFAFGLLMDVHSGAVLGQHALAYTLLSFFAVTIHRRLLWFTVPSQAVQILPLFLAAQAVSLVVADDRRRHVSRLAADPRACRPGDALAGRDLAVARAAAARPRSGREPAAMRRSAAADARAARAPGRPKPGRAPLGGRAPYPAAGGSIDRVAQHRARALALSAAHRRGGAVRAVRLRPARGAPGLPAGRQARRALDPGREQPHLGGPDPAQPRPDPRSQRRRPGQQLLGLHARDRALEGRRPRRDDRPAGRDRRDPAARPAPLQAPARGGTQPRVAADPHAPERRGGRPLYRAALPLRRRRDQGAAVSQLSARRGRQPPDRLHRPHQPGREEADGGRLDRGRARQLPRHRVHRQARRRAELRERAARLDRLRGGRDQRQRARGAAAALESGDAGQRDRDVDRHPPAGDGRRAVRRPARRAGRDRSEERRGARLRQQAEFRPEPVRRRHRRRELEGAQRVARQAAAEPGAARHLSAGLDLQAVHGAGRADARQAHAAADDLRPGLLQFRQPSLSRRQGRRPRHGRHVQVDRPVLRYVLLHARRRPRRRRDPRLHGPARPRPD